MMNNTNTATVLTATHLKLMATAIARAVGKRSDMDDILQDACVRVLSQLEAFDPSKGSLNTFVAKVAGNVARGHAKYEGYRVHEVMAKTRDDEGKREDVMAVNLLMGDDGRSEVVRAIDARAVADAIASLESEDDRTFVRMLLRGVPQTEAGKKLGWSAATATRKRKALGALLAKATGNESDDDSEE